MKDHQPQTFVSKHDLALLHKKIIATDLIVQKYQEANKALVTLQVENEQLRQQIDQITNECCIFGKQVTECTQECDHLKEQMDVLNGEKRQMQLEINKLNDMNTSYYHEIVVLKQYESLKEINDESTRIIERKQKEINKLKLSLQRQTQITYRQNQTSPDLSELQSSLVNSQKSIRELKLALGRMMNYLQTKKIEIPKSLNIKPVLKAHSIDDDFLEIEGEFVLRPVKELSMSAVNNHNKGHSDDDLVDVNLESNVLSMQNTNQTVVSSTGELQKSKETVKKKKTAKSAKKISKSDIDDLDEFATQLEMAITQGDNQPKSPPSKPISFSSDEDEPTSQQSEPILQAIKSPITRQMSPISNKTSSTIEFTRPILKTIDTLPEQTETIKNTEDVSCLSDNEDERLTSSESSSMPIKKQPSDTDYSHRQNQILVPLNTTAIISSPVKTSRSISFLSDDDEVCIEQHTESVPITTITAPITESSNIPETTIEVSQSTMSDTEIQETNLPDKQSILTIDILTTDQLEVVFRFLNLIIKCPERLKPLSSVKIQTRTSRKKGTSVAVKPIETNVIEEDSSVPMDTCTITTLDETLAVPEESKMSVDVSGTLPAEEQIQTLETNNDLIEEAERVEKTVDLQSVEPEASMDISVSNIDTKPDLSVECETNTKKNEILPSIVQTSVSDTLLETIDLSFVRRLLTVVTTLPSNPAQFPKLIIAKKRKRNQNSTQNMQSEPKRLDPVLSRVVHSHSRMQTRSLTSIRSCIARCNRPTVSVTPKRSAPDPIFPTTTKRVKSATVESECDPLQKFLRNFSIEISSELKIWIEERLKTDLNRFVDEFFRIINDMVITKCDIILPLVNRLHPCEESLKIILRFIQSQSTIFRENLLEKFKESFRSELNQRSMTQNRLKIINRLFLLTVAALNFSSVVSYGRLFDIGYYYDGLILSSALIFTKHICPLSDHENSSNTLLHSTLYDMFIGESKPSPLEYVEQLFLQYPKCTSNYEDLTRSFVLICRHQKWTWCSKELLPKLIFPLIQRLDQRSLILSLLQCILVTHKDNDELREDSIFRDELKKLLESLEMVNREEWAVRNEIYVILDTCFK